MQSETIAATLAETERRGLRLTLMVRTALVAFVIAFIGSTQGISVGWFGMSVVSVFLVTGLVYLWLVRAERDREWMRFAFVTLDMALLAIVAVDIPLSIHGEVPQIFVFRVYGVTVFFFLLATSALSLSPRLVMWTGFASVVTIWSIWGWIISGMERWVRWSAIADDRTAEKYIEIVLDPDHINVAGRVVESIFLLCTAAVTAAAVQRARTMLRDQISAEQARSQVAEIFGHYVPTEVVESLSESGGTLAPTSREATVMFVDIEGFTGFAERADPIAIVETLDAFFDEVSECIARHDGVVISLIGDAALAAFNAPLVSVDHARDAISAAEDLIVRTGTRLYGGNRLNIRVGLATGPVAAGSVGGRGLRSYTLYGDTVNLAQRLEALNKTMGTQLLIAEPTWREAGAPPGYTLIESVPIKGRTTPVGIYARENPPRT